MRRLEAANAASQIPDQPGNHEVDTHERRNPAMTEVCFQRYDDVFATA